MNLPDISEAIFNTPNIINFFVALGTCSAVIVALISKKQTSFEATFALLLNQHNQALKELKNNPYYLPIVNNVLDATKSLAKQNDLFHKHDDVFGSYFRILYHLLKFIDNNAGFHPFDISRKKIYTSLVRSQLDNEITLLLAINCSHANAGNQYQNYKLLIERYSMLEHLILKNESLIKYRPLYISEDYIMKRIADIMTSPTKTMLEEIASTYIPQAFGSNPDFKKLIINK